MGTRCVPFEGPRTMPALPPQRPTKTAAALQELASVLGHGRTGLPGWFSRRSQLAAQLKAGHTVETPAWDLGVAQGVLISMPVAGIQSPIDVEHIFLGDNLVGFGLRFRLADPADIQLFDRLRAEASKVVAEPGQVEPGVEKMANADLEVHIQRHPSPALTQAFKKPVDVARLHYLCPKANLDRAVAKAVP